MFLIIYFLKRKKSNTLLDFFVIFAKTIPPFLKPLSLIIITYNRPQDTLELLQNIATLAHANELLQDIVIINNASTSDYTDVKKYVVNSNLAFQYIDAPSNLGVTKGRNFALQYAKGDICIFLDDDALLQNKDALQNVVNSFNVEGIDTREVAIISFKVLYHSTLQMQVNALPHKQFDKYKDKQTFFTYYFAGGAHAIKRKILDEVGHLPDEFFYGMEEYDLSYRIIDKGYCIKYDASIVMLHKESPLGRKPKQDKLRMMWINKCKVAYRYLPTSYFYSTAIMWGFQYLKETRFDVVGFFKGWKFIFSIPSTEKRMPISRSALEYLKDVEARLWY
jgi:GT2 family glycosyltransferase